MAYQPYGYELNNLMERYGVSSPVVPRQQEGMSASDYQAILDQYQKSVSSTPEYNIPKGGSTTYRDLLKNTLYGDPKTYFATRGITDPTQMYGVSTNFGWTPAQWDQSMGKPPGTAQQWIDGNINGRPPQSPGTTSPTTTTPTTTQPTTGGALTPAPQWSAPPNYNPQDTSTWSPEELEWAAAQEYTGMPSADIRTIDDFQNYLGQATSSVGNSFGDTRIIDSGETAGIFQNAAALGLSPQDIADRLGMEGVGAEQVVNRLKEELPHIAKNYLNQHGYNYAEGGMVRGYADGGNVDEDPLDAILRRYQQPTDLSAQIAAVRDSAAARKAAIEAMNVPQAGPSDSEKWLQLAAAFANPGKTGNFMEGVGQAAGVLATHRGAERDFEARDAERRNQLALEALGVDQGLAEAELNLGLDERDRADRQLSDLMRQYEGRADRDARAQEAEADRALRRELAPASDMSARDEAQVRFLTTQYEGYLRAAQNAVEIGDDASAQLYTGLAQETAAKIESMFGGEPSVNAPPPGSVVDGFEFMGGDPNDQASWRPVSSAAPAPAAPPAAPEAAATPPAPAAPAQGALEGMNTQRPDRFTLGDIPAAIAAPIGQHLADLKIGVVESAAQQARDILQSGDVYKLATISRPQLEAVLRNRMLSDEETAIVTAFLESQ